MPQPDSAVSNDAILDGARQLMDADRICHEANSAKRHLLKRLGNEGIDTKALLSGIRLAKRDPGDAIAFLSNQIRFLALRKVDVTRESLFDGWDPQVSPITQHTDDLWTAGDKGYRAGYHGADIAECPYEAGSDLQAEWITSWHKGQALRARELGPNARQADASRERPKRAPQPRIPGTEEQDRPRAPRKRAAEGTVTPIRGRRRGAAEGAAAIN